MDESRMRELVALDVEEQLSEFREKVERGDGRTILTCLVMCLSGEVKIPDWLIAAFIDAYFRALDGSVRSWDEVFGRPHKKGMHPASIRKFKTKSPAVWLEVNQAYTHEGRAIDEGLFEEVGRKYGLGKTLAAEYYYAFKKKAEEVVAESKRKAPDMECFSDEAMMVGIATYLTSGDDAVDRYIAEQQP